MTLDEIKEAHRVSEIWTTHSVLNRQIHEDRAKLIEWLDKALTHVRDKTQSSTIRGEAARALLREIEGEMK